MTYTDKVKASKEVLSAIQALKDGESVIVSYGTDYEGKPREYQIKCYIYGHTGATYSIFKNDVFTTNGMNIESLGRTIAKTYAYDMMAQRTTYNFPLYKMKIVKESK